MNPAIDLTCKLRASSEDREEIFHRVDSALGEYLSIEEENLTIIESGYAEHISLCYAPGGKSGRYIRLFQFEERHSTVYGPFKGRNWRQEMAETAIELAQDIFPQEDPGVEFVAAILNILEELVEYAPGISEIFAVTRFTLPEELLSKMKVFSVKEEDGTTEFGFLGVINAALKEMGSKYEVVSCWEGPDFDQFGHFAVRYGMELLSDL